MILLKDIKIVNRNDSTFMRIKEEKTKFERKEFAVAVENSKSFIYYFLTFLTKKTGTLRRDQRRIKL